MTQTAQQNVPNLRFPGFEGEWKSSELRDLAKVFDGTHQTPKYTSHGVPFVSVENINDIYGSTKFISEEAFSKDFKTTPQENDILMTRITAGIIGATAIVKNSLPLAYYVSLALIRPGNSANTPFLAQRIESDGFKRELHKRIIHVAFPKKINLGDIGKCIVTLPTLAEQRKIAGLLGAVDTKITQLADKKRLLEHYKNGCMQHLFSQTIRFKDEDGKDFPDWEEKRLGEIGKTFGGLTGKSADDFGTGSRFVTYLQVFKASKIYPEQCGFVKLSAGERQNKIERGDIIFTTSSETPKEVGFASVVTVDMPNTYLNSFCFALRPDNTEELIPEFSRYLFRSAGYRTKVIPLAQGSTRYNLSKTSFLKIKLHIPHPIEQRKIADFLSALDRKIELVTAEFENAKTFKKGILQQMFV